MATDRQQTEGQDGGAYGSAALRRRSAISKGAVQHGSEEAPAHSSVTVGGHLPVSASEQEPAAGRCTGSVPDGPGFLARSEVGTIRS